LHPGVLSKRQAAATDQIAASVRQIADLSGQDFVLPDVYVDLAQNMGASTDLRLLAVTELAAIAFGHLARLLAESHVDPVVE
jgi:hypothetical protein